MTNTYIITIDGMGIRKYAKVDSQRVYVVKHYKNFAKAKDALWRIVEKTFKTPSTFEIYRCWGDKPDEKKAVYLCKTSKINLYQYSVIIKTSKIKNYQ